MQLEHGLATGRSQFEMFLPYLSDLQFRDQREMMERPFFSIAKSKRIKPIDYNSPDKSVWVHVSCNPDYGMATIWDADILVYCASVLADMQRRRINDIPRRLKIVPHDLLRAIGRDPGGRGYELLGQALDRLTSTTIKTNIRARDRRETTFNWLDGWERVVQTRGNKEITLGMSIDLSNWFYEGVLMNKGVLSIDRAYFDLQGGRERWLYKVARKHAGGAGEEGFAISLPTLFEKSGAEGNYRRFKFEVAKIVAHNQLPGFELELEYRSRGEPLLRMRRRSVKPGTRKPAAPPVGEPTSELSPTGGDDVGQTPSELVDVSALIRSSVGGLANSVSGDEISERTRSALKKRYPGWDLDELHKLFRAMIQGPNGKRPDNYQAAFAGFVKHHNSKHGAEQLGSFGSRKSFLD